MVAASLLLFLIFIPIWTYGIWNIFYGQASPILSEPPKVILQSGTAGASTIYTNSTSAKVSVVAERINIENYVDNNTSDIDSSAGKGTHSNFTAQQYGPDSTYDTLTEENTGGGGSSNINLWVNAYDATYDSWTKVGAAPYLDAQDQPANYGYSSVDKDDWGIFDFNDTPQTGTINAVTLYLYARCTAAGQDMNIFLWDGTAFIQYIVYTPTSWGWVSVDVQATLDTWAKINAARLWLEMRAKDKTQYVDAVYIRVDYTEPTTYELDLEVQWVNVDYNEVNEELCIYGGTMASEDLRVDVWNGTTWQNVFTDLTNGWNNVSVIPYLDSSNFTIRFKGSIETGDTTQDNWNIDTTLLHVWSVETTYDYVLQVNNTVADSWQIRLKKYSEFNINRLQNCTIYFHNGGSDSRQIYVNEGSYEQQFGNWYDLAASSTYYIAVTVSTNSTGTSYIYTYLEILVPDTKTYNQYIITFEIT